MLIAGLSQSSLYLIGVDTHVMENVLSVCRSNRFLFLLLRLYYLPDSLSLSPSVLVDRSIHLSGSTRHRENRERERIDR